jgi:hypothetical protein
MEKKSKKKEVLKSANGEFRENSDIIPVGQRHLEESIKFARRSVADSDLRKYEEFSARRSQTNYTEEEKMSREKDFWGIENSNEKVYFLFN